jgi:transcriptional regulator with XRE-family HTH domain
MRQKIDHSLVNRSSRPLSVWGITLRNARELHNVSISELATKLGVTRAYVGQSEFEGYATKIIPRKYWDKLIEALPSLTKVQLERAAAESARKIIIDIDDLSHDQTEAAIHFAAYLSTLPREDCLRIIKFLKENPNLNKQQPKNQPEN